MTSKTSRQVFADSSIAQRLLIVLVLALHVSGCHNYQAKPRPDAIVAPSDVAGFKWEIDVQVDVVRGLASHSPAIGPYRSIEHLWIYTNVLEGTVQADAVAVTDFRGLPDSHRRRRDLTGHIDFRKDGMSIALQGPNYNEAGDKILSMVDLPINGSYRLLPAPTQSGTPP